jgi:PEP-CTERM putative exosortase interaction domain
VSRSLIALLISLALTDTCDADVISYLRFEEGSGSIAYDQTGLMDGELIGIWDETEGWMTDVPTSIIPLTGQPNNYSLRFGGGSEYIDISNANTLSLGSAFTIEFYMKPATDIIIASLFGLSPSSGLSFIMADVSGELVLRGTFDEAFGDLIPATLVEAGTWQHFALVMEPTEYTIYIDGQQQYKGPIPTGGEGPYEFPGSVVLGSRTIGGPTGTWRGWIDEFRISSEALMPDQFLIAPEPSTFLLLGAGAAALALHARRRFRRK